MNCPIDFSRSLNLNTRQISQHPLRKNHSISLLSRGTPSKGYTAARANGKLTVFAVAEAGPETSQSVEPVKQVGNIDPPSANAKIASSCEETGVSGSYESSYFRSKPAEKY